MGSTTGKRNYTLDFIRAISMCMVIMCHAGTNPFSFSPVLASAFYLLLLSCNANYFMISGHLNLNRSYDTAEDFKHFYLSKVLTILLPFIIYSGIHSIWDMIETGEPLNLPHILKTVYVDFMQNHHWNHMWFMYYFLIVVFLAPFIKKALDHLKKYELIALAAITAVYAAASTYLTAPLSISFKFSTITWWIIPFILGYLVPGISKKMEKPLYIAGAAAFILQVILRTWIPGIWDMTSPDDIAFIVWTLALYLLMERHITITNKTLCSILKFLSRFSFSVYLIHWNVLNYWVRPLVYGTIENNILCFIAVIVLALLISLAISIVVDYILIKPIQTLILWLVNHKMPFQGKKLNL